MLKKADISEIMKAQNKNNEENLKSLLNLLNFKNAVMMKEITKKVGKLTKENLKKYMIKNTSGEHNYLICAGQFQGEELRFFSIIWFREIN